MVKLYRAVSQDEKDDYDIAKVFRTGKNTLEAKQFFKSKMSIMEFVERSLLQGYIPPYLYLLIINLEEVCLNRSNATFMNLDGFNAVNVAETDLISFNKCVIFVNQELL